MEKLKNIFLENKKAFLYRGLGLLSLIILIIVIIILVNVFRRYGPSQVESMMVEAAKEYLSEHREMTPTAESGPVTIEVNTLVEGKYLKDLSKLSTEEGCTGNIKVVFNNKLTGIGVETFKDCSSLKEAHLPKKIKYLY